MSVFVSDWTIIGNDTQALIHTLLMRLATATPDSDEVTRLYKDIDTLAKTIYAPPHDDTARARSYHSAAELEPFKRELRVSIKRMSH